MAMTPAIRRFGLWVLLAYVGSSAFALRAPDTPPPPQVTIGEALRDDNHDYIPDRLGQSLTIEGVVTTEPVEVSSAALANIQDETGGIVLFTRNKALLSGAIHRGDLVRAQGKLSQHKGAEELVVERLERLDRRPVPAPREVLAADLNSERYSGQLVRVVGELRVAEKDAGRREQFLVRDRSGEIAIHVSERFFQESRFADRLMRGGHAAVVGVASQYCEKPPYNSGYRVVLLDSAGITFAPIPPYKVIALVLAVLGMGAAVWLWSRRQRRKRREKAFEQADAQRRLQEAVLNQMPAGAVVVEADTRRVLFDNEEGGRLYAGQHELFESALNRCITDGRVFTEELEIGDNGSKVFLRVSSAPIRDHKGRLFAAIVTFYDITESKRAEAALRSAEKLAVTGRMAATIAHEINNPLTAMMNLLFLLRGRCSSDDQYRTYLDSAQAELNRVVHIVNQTLSLYRSTATAGQVNVAELVDDLLEAYASRLEQRRLVVRRSHRGGTNIWAYAVELRQVLSNLLLNAIDAAHSTIQVRVRESRNGKNPGERGIRVTVADDGSGIPPELRGRVFEPFFTTKADKGTGLGLWVVQGMVHKHNGSVQVRSSSRAARSGTVMSVFIPSLAGGNGTPASMPVPGEAVAGEHAVV